MLAAIHACRSEPAPREGEKVVCADAATQVLWENKFNVFLSDVPAERVAWSCCVGDPTTGRVYAMGVCGYLQCLDGETGKTLWSRSLNEEFGLLSTYGGRTNVPVIFENLVIISAVTTGWGELARPAHRFMAFDKSSGTLVWMNGTRPLPDDTTYSTPALTVFNGQAAMVFGSGDGAVWAFQPRTGKPIWTYRLSLRGMNTSPLVLGDTVYMGQSEENRDDSTMGALAAIKGTGSDDITKTGELWRVKEMMIGKSSPILLDGRLYALDDSNVLYVVNAATGELIGKKTRLAGTIARASLVYADGKIYACTTSVWHVLEPTEDGVKIVHRLRLKLSEGEEVHGSPIVSHGRIYLPTTLQMYCLGKPTRRPIRTSPPADARPAAAKRSRAHRPPARTGSGVPVEAMIRPGEQVNSNARSTPGATAQVAPADVLGRRTGQIDGQGQFTADKSFRKRAGASRRRVSRPKSALPERRIRSYRRCPEIRFRRQPGAHHLGRRPLPSHRPRDGRQQGHGQGDDHSQGDAQPKLDGPDGPARLHRAGRRPRRDEEYLGWGCNDCDWGDRGCGGCLYGNPNGRAGQEDRRRGP
jgi:outer membrane protein assembly factor BamB